MNGQKIIEQYSSMIKNNLNTALDWKMKKQITSNPGPIAAGSAAYALVQAANSYIAILNQIPNKAPSPASQAGCGPKQGARGASARGDSGADGEEMPPSDFFKALVTLDVDTTVEEPADSAVPSAT